MNKIVLLLIPLLAGVVVLGYIVTSVSTKQRQEPALDNITTYTSEQEWVSEIKKCIPKLDNPTVQLYAEYGTPSCLEKVMIAAYETRQVENMSSALQKIVDTDINFYMLCHPVAHSAGLKALDFTENLEDLLNSAAKSTVCDWGMGHGILDALAETKPNIDIFMNVSQWCDKQKSNQRLYSLCVDGLGHVAWGGTDSFEEAVQWCEQIPEQQGRTECGGGIVMQKYAPASGKNPANPPDLHKDMVKLCTDWEQYVRAEGALNGCFAGAAYMYGTELVVALDSWWRDPKSYTQKTMPVHIEKEIYTIFENNIQKCQDYASDRENICEKSLANQIPPRLTQENKKVHENLCSMLTDAGAKGNCERGLLQEPQ